MNDRIIEASRLTTASHDDPPVASFRIGALVHNVLLGLCLWAVAFKAMGIWKP